MLAISKYIRNFFLSGHERTLKIRKNAALTLVSKGLSVAIGFVLVPLAWDFVNPVQYGVWLTIASIVTWTNTFDIGLSNGMRNKIAHALAVGQNQAIVSYISTTYAFLIIIACATFGIFCIAGSFFNWNQLLSLPQSVVNIWPLIVISLAFFCIQFVLQALNSILTAVQQNYKASFIQMGGQALTLCVLIILTHYTKGQLYLLVLVVSASPIIILLLAHFYFFNTSLKPYRPSLSTVNLRMGKELFSLGGVFFLIQIGALILYETDTIVITKITGPANVSSFNAAYKYFSLLTLAFSILITPYWSAFTDAFAKKDFVWIKGAMRRMRLIWLGFVLAAILLCAVSGLAYKLWIGQRAAVPFMLTASIALYTVLQLWTDIHAYLLNGIGKLRIQLILVITTGILNIPLSVFLIKQIGVHGTVMANIIMLLIINAFITYQSQLIIKERARGVWNR